MNRAGKYIFRLKRNGTGVRIPHSGTVRVEQLLNCGRVLPDALPNTNTLPLMDTDCAFFSNEPLQAFSRLAMPCGPEPAEHVFFACYDFAQNETRVSVTYTHKKAGQPKTKYKHKKPTSVTYGISLQRLYPYAAGQWADLPKGTSSCLCSFLRKLAVFM